MGWECRPPPRRAARSTAGRSPSVVAVSRPRRCSRTGCAKPAVATLTYAYSDSTAVVGPLATAAEPHSYDLCSEHAVRLTAPKGWEIVRPDGQLAAAGPGVEDLEALADAVREAGRGERAVEQAVVTGRRGHLRVLRFDTQPKTDDE